MNAWYKDLSWYKLHKNWWKPVSISEVRNKCKCIIVTVLHKHHKYNRIISALHKHHKYNRIISLYLFGVKEVFWTHSIEGQNVVFNGVPFIVSSTRKQHCQFGQQYFKPRSATSGWTRVQGTHKIDRLKHVQIRELTLLPSYAHLGSESWSKWRQRKSLS